MRSPCVYMLPTLVIIGCRREFLSAFQASLRCYFSLAYPITSPFSNHLHQLPLLRESAAWNSNTLSEVNLFSIIDMGWQKKTEIKNDHMMKLMRTNSINAFIYMKYSLINAISTYTWYISDRINFANKKILNTGIFEPLKQNWYVIRNKS